MPEEIPYEESSDDMMTYESEEGRIIKRKGRTLATTIKDTFAESDEAIRQSVIRFVRNEERCTSIDSEISELNDEKKSVRESAKVCTDLIRNEMESRGLKIMIVGCQLIEILEDGSISIEEIYVAK